ncbi:MAG: cyclic pyranopterin monophosphate synthase MoaC [Synergistes sp.]|nr:cyclic pyranopterin monophosphate synthase MoaC [Synergistes sp.]
MGEYTHFDRDGRPTLVDVSGKDVTKRVALAEGWVYLPEEIFKTVSQGGVKKGDPFRIAELGGIMGAKRTPNMIPLCHTIRIDNIKTRCDLVPERQAVRITCEASATEVTGVEMEALTGVSIAALTFYDMCKGIDKGMIIKDIRLLKKTGGKSGTWCAEDYREGKENI